MRGKEVSRALAAAALFSLCAGSASAAMTTEPMPTNPDGSPRFADPNEAVFAAAPGAVGSRETRPPENPVVREWLEEALAVQSHESHAALTSGLAPRKPVDCLDCTTPATPAQPKR